MATFNFYQDQKVRIWRRVFIEVEAETEEDAIARLKELNLGKQDVYNERVKDMEIIDTEMLYDTEELISVEENFGDQTIEVYMKNAGPVDKLLMHNAE